MLKLFQEIVVLKYCATLAPLVQQPNPLEWSSSAVSLHTFRLVHLSGDISERSSLNIKSFL